MSSDRAKKRSIDRDTGYFVTRTARAFMKAAEAQLRPLGLGVAHAPVLVCLAEEGSLTQVEIARRTHVEQPTVAALLKRMETADLIEKTDDPADGRAFRVHLSARAEKVLPRALARLAETNDQATAGLTVAEVKTLHSLLRRVLENLAPLVDGSAD